MGSSLKLEDIMSKQSNESLCRKLHTLPGSKKIRYSQGSVIFLEGTPIFGLYCLSNGKIKLSKTELDGKEVILQIMGPDEIIAHRCFFSREEFATSATALEDSEIILIEKSLVLNSIENDPDISKAFLVYLGEQLELSDIRVSSLMRKKVAGRIAEFFLNMNNEFGTLEEGTRKLDIHLSRDEIASIVGTSAETVTRFMTEFKESGIISERDKIFYINDREKLEKISLHL
jgi:CRP-like cAMP-binding protein